MQMLFLITNNKSIFMKKITCSLAFLISVLSLTNLELQAQSCNTGKLDPKVADFLKMIPADHRTLEDLRKTTNFEEDKKAGPPAIPYPITDAEHIKITADSIPVLVFNPSHTKGLPIIIHYHGGGFIQPIVPWMEHSFWDAANKFNAIVFAIDYRVAPEYKFPAAVNDCYNAFKWISEHGGQFGGDTSRIIIKGESSGANLVAVVCQKAKQEGIAHRIKLQVMNSPLTDNPDHAQLYPSMQQNATGYFLTKASVLFSMETYADKKDYSDPAFAPILFKNLSGLPPAVIITAEFDPLRDEGIAYAERLKKAGVRVWDKCFPGQIHALIASTDETSKEAKKLVLNAMKEVMTQ
jgi:acetyl esterase